MPIDLVKPLNDVFALTQPSLRPSNMNFLPPQVFCDPTLPGPGGAPAGVAEVGPGRVYVSGKSAAASGRITQCQLEVGGIAHELYFNR